MVRVAHDRAWTDVCGYAGNAWTILISTSSTDAKHAAIGRRPAVALDAEADRRAAEIAARRERQHVVAERGIGHVESNDKPRASSASLSVPSGPRE